MLRDRRAVERVAAGSARGAVGRWAAGVVVTLGVVLVGVLGVAGCAGSVVSNPAFRLTEDEAIEHLREMRARPVALARPVVVLSGYRDPAPTAAELAAELMGLTSGRESDFLACRYPLLDTEAALVAEVVRRVEAKWPSEDPLETVEVDVVGISMGGLIGRAAALSAPVDRLGRPVHKRLRVVTVYTLATPHRGARLAERVAPDAIAREMRAGSALIRRVDADLARGEYKVVAYTKLRDGVVGAGNASPTGQEPVWVPGSVVGNHFMIQHDRRIVADMARRLRGERPLGEASIPPSE